MKLPTIKLKETNHSERYYYLDWLRLLALLIVFFHHCSKFFDYHTATVYNTVRSPVLSVIREFNFIWLMPIFFFISGASSFFSLTSRKTGQFLTTRILRILVPLVIIGTFVINPPYIYIERLFDGHTVKGFIQWYPHFFDGIWPKGNFAPLGMGTHLWYLQSLFVYSLILLPLFTKSNASGKSYLAKMAPPFRKPWALLLLFVPISAASATFEFIGLGGIRVVGGWDPISFLIFFMFGYLCFSNTQIIETIKNNYKVYLITAAVLSIFYIDTHFGINLKIPGITKHNIHKIDTGSPLVQYIPAAVQAFRGLLGWLWVLGLIGFGIRFLKRNTQFLVYGNNAVLPFYILHHTIILIFGYFIIQWDSSIFVKFIVIVGSSVIFIITIYEFLVRRLKLIRFLFGMKI